MAPWLRAAGQSRDLRSLRGLGLRLRGGQTLDDGVAQVLRTLGLERHAAAFEREGIHTRNLVDLTDDDLGELGLLEPDRQAFLAHVSFAQKQAPAQAKLAAERTWKVASGKRSKQGESNSLHVARQPKKSRTGVAAGKLEEDNPGKSVPAENHPGKQGEKEGGGGTHLERLLLLLSGAHARSSREAAGCALAQVFCDQPAYQAHIAAHLQRLVRHTSWDTRDAAASTLSHILAASPCTSPASQARHCLTPDRRSFAGGVLRSFDLEGELLARQDQILLECAEHAPDEGRSHQQVLSQTQQTTTEPQGSGKSDSLAGASITLGYCGGGAGGAEEVERGPWWPFDGLCEEFYSDLLDQAWQRRHGAALALKHLLRHHPCLIPTTFAEPAPARTSRCGWGATRAFAEECGTQLLRVLALDRFSDFSGDLVVSPVREASAQALALLVQTLDTKCTSDTRRNGRDVDTDAGNADSQNCSAAAEDSAADSGVVVHVVDMLERMMKWQEDWELRHSALIVLKYMVALSPQSAGSLKRAVSMAGWRMVMAGLVDDSDDVRCVAAQAALALARDGVSPASPAAATAAKPAAVLGRGESQETKASASAHQDPDRTFDCIVWESLEECDQLSSSTAPLLQLLSWRLGELHAKDGGVRAQDMRDLFGDNLSRLKRVLSFMAHHLVSVRGAAIDILERVVAAYPALLLPDPRGGGATREGGFAAEALEVVYLSALIETREHLTPRLQSLWQQIVCQVACGGPRWFQAAVRMREWCEAAATPQHHPLSLRSICRSQEYLQCLSSSASHTAAAEAAGPRSKHTGGERACVGKGKGRGKGKGEKDGTAGGSSTYDIGTRTREVACRMMACLLRAQPSEIGGETRENWAVVERMALSSNPWSAFVASWVSMEALSFSLPPSPHAASTRGDRLETEKGKCEGNGGAELRLPARVLASLESLVPAGASNSAAPLQRDTAALAAGCLLLSRAPGAGDISQEALSDARAGSSAAESRKSEAGQRWQGSQGKGSDAQREQAASLMQVLLEAVASQSDAFMQQRTARVVTLLAQRRLLAASHTSALCADVCLEPSITPLPGAALPDHSDTAQEDSGCRGVTAETLLRSVPKSGLEDLTSLAEMSVSGAQADSGDRRGVVMRRVRQRGAQSVLESAAAGLGEDLLVCLPLVWEVSGAVLGQDQHVSDARMIKALQLVEVLLPHSARGVGARMSEAVLAVIARILTRSNAGARHMAARACARVAGFDPLGAIEVLVRQVLPMLQEAGSPIVDARLGAIEAVYRTIQELGERLLPYAVLFLSPVLARMSDSDPAVRETATRSFAVLLQALPLERSVPDPVGLPPDLVAGRQRERRVLEQLCDPTALDAYSISANLTAELRPYQQEGVNWLGFLVTYNLHGILCDDMGLGKTLQTIAVLASDTVNRRARFRETGLDCHRPLPSLIVCPSTLVPHWCHEVSKFCRDVEAVAYGGSAAHRNATLGSLDGSDKLLVVSYEAVRGDIELFLSRRDPSWNFAVLDEGHIIKNPKSKLTQAVKRVGLGAAHRLILTGTPIQNNVLELWGLFDFLMPSFLGSDRDFNSRYRWQFVSACLPTCMYVRRHACGAADSRVTDVSDTVTEVSHAMTEVSPMVTCVCMCEDMRGLVHVCWCRVPNDARGTGTPASPSSRLAATYASTASASPSNGGGGAG